MLAARLDEIKDFVGIFNTIGLAETSAPCKYGIVRYNNRTVIQYVPPQGIKPTQKLVWLFIIVLTLGVVAEVMRLFGGFTDDGESLDQELCERLFRCKAEVEPASLLQTEAQIS